MASIPNPPLFDESNPPAALQVLRLNAAGTAWEPAAITAAAVTVPQSHVAQVGAAAAVTSVQEATANAAAQSGSYVQADVQSIAALANSLKIKYNAAQVDVAALRAEVAALTTALNTVMTELQTAGILSAS